MEKRILGYVRYIDSILAESSIQDVESLKKEHLVQLSFFQHERLIHLIVTITFAILEMFAMMMCVLSFSLGVMALAIAILILLLPYIRHYYILENQVQKMYVQYDKILEKMEGRKTLQHH